MSNFDEKIFDYFTKPNNFRSAFEIAEHLPRVKSKLLEDFWKKVEKVLEELCKETKLNPKLFYELDYLHINSAENWGNKLSVYYAPLESKPDIGIWIGNNDNTFDSAKIYEEFKDKEPFKSLDEFKQKDFKWRLGRQYAFDSFDNIASLEKILPDHCDATAKIYAERLFEFARSFDESLQRIKNMKIAAGASPQTHDVTLQTTINPGVGVSDNTGS